MMVDEVDQGEDGRCPSGRSAAPSGLSPSASQAKPAATNARWVPGVIVTRHPQDKSYTLVGWVDGVFGLDCRPHFDDFEYEGMGWVLTHLQSGFAALGVVGALCEAVQVAERMRLWGDWDFSDPLEAKRFQGKFAPLREAFPDIIQSPSSFALTRHQVASGIVAATAGETEGLDERSEQSPVGAAETPEARP